MLILSGDVELNPGPKDNFLSLGHINARSLNIEDKFDEISLFITSKEIDLFGISETWLNNNSLTDNTCIPGYHPLFRKDRQNSRGGGVALFASEFLNVKRRSDLENDDLELLWVEIEIYNFTVFLAVCYRPPNDTLESTTHFLNAMQFSLDSIERNPNSLIVLLGDFNAHFDASDLTSSTHFGARLYYLFECNNLFQLIQEPTRITKDKSSILDLIITDAPSYFISTGTHSPPSNCDHNFIFAKMNFSRPKPQAFKRFIWDFKSVLPNDLNDDLIRTNWHELTSKNCDINVFYKEWFSIFKQCIEKHIPYKEVVIRPRDKEWMNCKVRSAIRKRNRLLKKFDRIKSIGNWNNYKQQRNLTTSLIRDAKANYYLKLNNDLSNPSLCKKKWWSTVKSLYNNKIHMSIPSLKENLCIITDAKQKADIFNAYFVSQATVADIERTIIPIADGAVGKILSTIQTSTNEIEIIISNLDPSKACGHDKIGNKIIKMCIPGLLAPLTMLCNRSLLSGEFPSDWKKANVIPLFKKDDRQNKTNYRPVSLLPSLSKILEKVVFTSLYKFLLNINFLNPLQSGFRPGDSTVNQLIYLVHLIYEALELGKEVRMVFLDISKAFDRVWHKGLLYKLEKIGIRDPLLKWFRSYLSDRQQRVVIESQESEWLEIRAGVPQGSVLGPLLFLIYINDITNTIYNQCLLYADDTSLLTVVEDPFQSASSLNSDLRKIHTWSVDWQVTMNSSKTNSMILSAKRSRLPHPPLFLNGNVINEVSSHTHLGLTLSSNMSWQNHVLYIYHKASKRLHMLKGLKYKVSRDTLAILYKSMIRSVVEYADCVWDGCSDELSQLLESIQYESAIVVSGALKGTSKQKVLAELGWENLKTRRLIHKLLLFYKIVNGHTPSFLRDILPSKVKEKSRFSLRKGDNFSPFIVRSERFKYSFFPSSVSLWNKLDTDVRNLDSFNLFKKTLKYFFHPYEYNKILSISLTRYASILHTRLRLGACALNSYLFQINRCTSRDCLCQQGVVETVEHFLLICPRYAAQRQSLLASAAQLIPVWPTLSSKVKFNILLVGSKNLTFEQNKTLFFAVQNYIISTKRFSIN